MQRIQSFVQGSIKFLLENSLFLILGAALGLIWANSATESYHHVVHFEIFQNAPFGTLHHGHRIFTLHFFVNDILMALFFALAGKEVFEAFLPGGPLSNFKKAANPLLATLGGMTGPAVLYTIGALLFGNFSELSSGWAIPCATDIAFSYMVARVVFGPKHPAIPFLLLLAIADDALGLIVLAVFYPQEKIQIAWMVLPILALGFCFILQRMRVHSFWPYLLVAGTLSWVGFAKAGIHPALGLLPIIPGLPHAHTDLGIFAKQELNREDTLSEFEEWWKHPIQLILGLFGLLNAGVVFSAMGLPTALVMVALIAGKPLGIYCFSTFASKKLGFGLPEGMTQKDLFVLGCVAGIGFTVALFVATVAFPPGGIQDAAKMGALFSFLAAIVSFIVAKLLGVKKTSE